MKHTDPTVAQRLSGLATVVATVLCVASAPAADWPMWRYDPQRSGVSPEALPRAMALRWEVQSPPPRRAWLDARLAFDAVFQPAVAGKTLVFGSSRTDRVTALDVESAAEKWRFFAQGPVRLPPVIDRGRVYVAADDSCLY